MPTLAKGRPSTFGVPVYLGDALQWNAREFMNQRDIEIVVPAERESLDKLPDEDDEKRIILRFPISVSTQPGLFDTTIEQMLSLAERKQPVSTVAAWIRRQAEISDPNVEMLGETYKALQRLQRERRNHIWGYVARNLSRPIWLASEKQKADVVIGNPPWLAYRAMNRPTQKRFIEEMKATGLWGGLSSVSGYDLSAYFFARSIQLVYAEARQNRLCDALCGNDKETLRAVPEGRVLRERLHRRRHSVTDAWAFPAHVQPLFPVPSSFSSRSGLA